MVNETVLDSRMEAPIQFAALGERIQDLVKETEVTYKVIDPSAGDHDLYRTSEAFRLFVDNTVAESEHVLFEEALRNTWNQQLEGKQNIIQVHQFTSLFCHQGSEHTLAVNFS